MYVDLFLFSCQRKMKANYSCKETHTEVQKTFSNVNHTGRRDTVLQYSFTISARITRKKTKKLSPIHFLPYVNKTHNVAISYQAEVFLEEQKHCVSRHLLSKDVLPYRPCIFPRLLSSSGQWDALKA